jgi:GntR family transcriptional regulator/MocR family aminotransferase
MLVVLDQVGPAYQQLYRALRHAILMRQMEPGSRLPSTRDLAVDLSVSRNTVLLAYEQLLAEGYVSGRVGAGTFVASELPSDVRGNSKFSPLSDPEDEALSNYARRALDTHLGIDPPKKSIRYDFRYGISSVNDFPYEIWRRIVSQQARDSARDMFSYGPPEGTTELREAIASYVRRARGVVCTADQVLVVNGSQQALDLVARTLLNEGDSVVAEDPCYLGAREVFRAMGARLVFGSVDQNGLDVDKLPPAARRSRLVYVTPSHQFPSGAVMNVPRRLALLAWAKECGAYIVEDDYDSEFRYDGRPIESVQSLDPHGPVIYVGTLSKTLSPSFRIGYLVVPQRLIAPFRRVKSLCDRYTSTLQQNVLTDLFKEGHFERHLRRARRNNSKRRAVLLESLKDAFGDRISIEGTNAGLHVVVWFKRLRFAETDSIVSAAEQANIGVYSIAPYYVSSPERAGLLLGYSALEHDQIAKGITQLAESLRPLLKH